MEYLIERPKYSPKQNKNKNQNQNKNKYQNKNIIYISPVLSIIAGITTTFIISLILRQIF